MELRLWKSANLAPDKNSPWYRDLGRGMGPTLKIAARLNALYAHRTSYLGFQLGLLE
jgi:ABC-type tungstate transport system permease subunit